MAKGHRELLMGFIRDDRFGPRIVVGFGGTLVEVLGDVVVRVGPLTDRDSVEMLSNLRGAALLDAYRGDPAVDKACVSDCLLRLNQLAFDFPEIGECEINPFIVAVPGKKGAAVDARIYVNERK